MENTINNNAAVPAKERIDYEKPSLDEIFTGNLGIVAGESGDAIDGNYVGENDPNDPN